MIYKSFKSKDRIYLFQSFYVFLLLVFAFNSLQAQTPRKSFIWGVNGHPLTQEAYRSFGVEKQMQIIKDLRLNYYRVDISTDGNGKVANDSEFKNLTRLAAQYNVKILPMFYLSGFSFSLSEDAAYAKGRQLGKGIATNYGQYFNVYEIGNEEELKLMMPNTDGNAPAHFDLAKTRLLAAFLNGMSGGIKAIRPSSQIMVNCAGWLHYGFFDLLNQFSVKYDLIGMHWYSEMGLMKNIRRENVNILDIVTRKFGKPIWITEINARYGNFKTEGEQSKWIKNFMNEARSTQNVKAFFIYELLDEPAFAGSAEAHYGVIKWVSKYKSYSYKDFSKIMKSDINR